MWLLIAREPRPDAPFWLGRHLLAAIDAVVWPALWVLLIRQVPEPVGVVGPFFTAVAVLSALGRLHRAVWVNHRYWFTTWRWAKIFIAMVVLGMVLKLALLAEPRSRAEGTAWNSNSSVRDRGSASAPQVEVDASPSHSALGQAHGRGKLVFGDQPIDR